MGEPQRGYNKKISLSHYVTAYSSPVLGDIAGEQCLRRREIYLPKGVPYGYAVGGGVWRHSCYATRVAVATGNKRRIQLFCLQNDRKHP